MKTKKRFLSLLLCGAMLFSLMPQMALAEAAQDSGVSIGTSGLCEHHTAHDENCGYTEGTEETPCSHEHTEDCYTLVENCVYEGGDSVSGNTASPSDAEDVADHVCSEKSGCITKELDCTHEHDENCGYAPATEGTPCGFECEECAKTNTATPPNAQQVTVESVQEQIDTLPVGDEITEDNAEEVKVQLETIDEAKAQLTDEEREQLDFTRYMRAIAALEALAGMAGASTPMLTATEVSYRYYDEGIWKTDTQTDYILITSDSMPAEWSNGWYVVQGSGTVTIDGRVQVNGAVNLILMDNVTLTCSNGIRVSSGNSLTIYAQSDTESTMGSLTANENSIYNAGIGGNIYESGGTITIHGGTVNATSDSGAGIGGGGRGSGGTITIHGGTVNATGGGDGAGIGGSSLCGGGEITIHGGTVNAIGGNNGAGIGGGQGGSGGEITISGGTVNATGGSAGAGIGNGNGYNNNGCNGGEITISGGTIIATGGGGGAGIGGGYGSSGGTITISDGNVTATGSVYDKNGNAGAGIGGGAQRNGYGGYGGSITISGGTVTVEGGTNAPDIGGGTNGSGNPWPSDKIEIDTSNATVKGKNNSDADISTHVPDNTKWVDTDSNNHWRPCKDTNCSYNHQYNSTGHSWTYSDGANGSRTKTCSTCNYVATLTLTGISVTTQPTLSYQSGASLDLTGLKITATYSDNSTKEIAYAENNGMSFSIDGSTISNSEVLSYTAHNGKTITVTYYNNEASTNALTVNGIPLTAPDNLQWNGTTATWSVVTNASSYFVQLFKGNSTTAIETKTISTGTETSCTFDSFTNPAAGSYTFTVTAKGTGNYSDSQPSGKSAALNFYTVSFNTNGGSAVSSQVIVSGGKVQKPQQDPTKTGHAFRGWYSDQGLTTEWDFDNDTISAEKTIYAKWEANTYTVTLNTNGGTINSGNVTSYTYGTGATLPADVTRTGYTFKGWYVDSSFSGQPVTEIGDTDTGNKEYWAKWEANTYTVTLNTNGGTIAAGKDVTSYTYGTSVTLPTDSDMTRTGYTFKGWYENSGFSGQSVTEIGDTDTGNKEYWAKWEANTYTVTLNTNGGTINSGNVTSYTYGTGATLPADVTRTGYTFKGWYENSGFSGQPVTEIGDTETGNKQYWAKWVSTDAGVTSASINGTAGTINDTEISVVLPYGTTSLPTENSKVSITPATDATVSNLTLAETDGSKWTFTVTAQDGTTQKHYIINVSIAENPATGNIKDIDAAKSVVENHDWTAPQATANTETAVKTWIEGQLAAMTLNGASYEVTMTDFTAATAGIAADRDGTNGSFAFTVKLYKGDKTGNEATSTYAEAIVTKSGTITATPYTKWTITVNAKGAGTVSGGGTFENGSTVTVTATPNGSRDYFIRWIENDVEVSRDATYSFVLTADRNLIAEFGTHSSSGGDGGTTTYYTLTFDTNGGSKIDTFRTSSYGKTVDLTAYIPTRKGYDFNGWYSDKDLTDKITSIRLNGSKTVYAGWTEKTGTTDPDDGKDDTDPDSGKDNPSTGAGNPFTDVKESDWFYPYVMYVYEKGLMAGTSSTTFSPNSNTTRAMIATILYRMAGSPKVEGKHSFTDVPYEPGTAWYYDAVTWAQQNGIVAGYEDGTFHPDAAITREQLMVFFYNYAKYKGYNTTTAGDLSVFTDAGEISPWAQEAMKWAVGSGVLNGKENNLLDPKGTATRAQVATILYNFLEKYKPSEEPGKEPGGQPPAAGGTGNTGSTGSTGGGSSKIPQTGDSSHLGLWLSTLLCSAAGLTLLLFLRLRRKEEDEEETKLFA